MLLTTETAHLNGTAACDESKAKSDINKKISNHPKNSHVLIFCDQVRYFVDMAVSRFDLGNSWLRSEARSMAKVTYEINQLIYSHCFCFVQIGPCILKTRHRQFIIWPWNCEVKVTAELKKKISVNLLAILIVIVTQTDSKYGINMCIGIYMYIYIYINISSILDCIFMYNLPWNIPLTNGHIFLRKYYLSITNV